MNTKQIVLQDAEIRVTIQRMVLQIAENHVENANLLLIGLNERGYFLAKLIQENLSHVLPHLKVDLMALAMDSNLESLSINNTNILIVDDVLNSGKTAFKAAAACLNPSIIRLETAFLAVREHRNFPIDANYVGLSIATTLQDHVLFDNENPQDLRVYLQ